MPARCETCSEPFITARSLVNRGLGRFCSRRCASKAHKGKPPLPLQEYRMRVIGLQVLEGRGLDRRELDRLRQRRHRARRKLQQAG